MKPTSRLTLLGILLAFATLNPPTSAAATHQTGTDGDDVPLSVDQRIARVAGALQEREQVAEQSISEIKPEGLGAAIASFLNRRGGGGFVNRGGGAFVNRGGAWGNGFRNGGGFLNRRW